MKRTLAAIVLGMLFFTGLANAMNVDTFAARWTGTEEVKIRTASYVGGIGEGFMWANAYLKLQGAKPLYCIPDDINMAEKEYMDALLKTVKEKIRITDRGDAKAMKELDESQVGVMLLFSLQAEYPCK